MRAARQQSRCLPNWDRAAQRPGAGHPHFFRDLYAQLANAPVI